MPHSSGGGSHGGGSHGGHGHGGGGGIRTSKTYFPGSHRYVYYRNHRPVYFYRQKQYTSGDLVSHRFSRAVTAVFLAVVYGVAIIPAFLNLFHFPRKLSLDYDSSIEIEDALGLVEREYDAILTSFQTFQDNTGVTPALLIIPNESWEEDYFSLEDYAYVYYVNHFADEKHWLIVYATDGDAGFEDWYWEGMQGDDTDPVITSYVADEFTTQLHRRLVDRTYYTVGEAIAASFDELNGSITKFSVHLDSSVIGLLFVILHGGLFFYFLVFQSAREEKRAKNSVELDVHRQYAEDTCAYCGGVYLHGIHLICPHCGAPIRAANREETQAVESE